MIDQSNRAGKCYINGSDNINDPNSLCIPSSVSSPIMTKRHKYQSKSRELLLNKRKLHRRTNQQLSPLCITKGKSV
jgi:hypothetical protein